MPHVLSTDRLNAGRSGVLVVDVQQRLLPVIDQHDALLRQVSRMVEVAGMLDVPVAATLQYPQGLGSLVPPLDKLIPTQEEKLDFSAAVCRQAIDSWMQSGRDQVIVVGIETHVCVTQTVLDLIAEGLCVYVVADAVASRSASDHRIAIERMRDGGAHVVPAESVLFEWLGSAKHDQFKAVSKRIKEFG